MNKVPCSSQNTEARTLPADVFVFGHLGRLSPAAVHSADRFGSMFPPLSHIYRKIPFCCVETVANNALNRRNVDVFDWLWPNTAPTLNTAFLLTNVHAKWWLDCQLISSTILLSHATSIYDRPKRVCGVFWCFPGELPNLGDWTFSYVYVCTTSFKVSIISLELSFWRSRVRITIIKPLLCLNIFFPTGIIAFSTHEIKIFPLFWKLQQYFYLNNCNC